ncbi:MAG: hypothetical protein ABI647_12830 [Gemmatimonadota bacterium]
MSVFIATSQQADIRLSLYDGVVDAANPPATMATADASTTRFGVNFHATLVTASLPGPNPLLPGHRYSYDIRITPAGGGAQSLKDLGFLSDSTLPGYGTKLPASETVEVCAIGYADGQLPSFVTCPAALDELVIVHASCRKPHGDGDPALKYIDDYIDDLDSATTGWPHMLFLTGDQIYADDVAGSLLPGLNSLAIDLVSGPGGDIGVEEIPMPVGSGTLKVNTLELPAGFRQKTTGLAHFSSEEAASHLIGFGEYLAMYCIAWNPMVWPVLGVASTTPEGIDDTLKAQLQDDATHSPDTAPTVLFFASPDAPPNVTTPLYGSTPEARTALLYARQGFLAEKELLDSYRREVAKVRRLLANVPTYMITDDHDVTDDWFLAGGLKAATLGNPFGRSLIRNALAAYTVCQAWGDDPVAWTTDADHTKVLAAVAKMFGPSWTGGLPDASAIADIDDVYGLVPGAQPKFDFSFVVEGPVHKVRVLDTRTRRQYDGPTAPPGLLTADALDHQLPKEDLPDGHVLVVVSPAPVFGPPLFNEIGSAILTSKYDLVSMIRSKTERANEEAVTGLPDGRPSSQQYWDVEHWSVHPVAFERLLERLSHYTRVVVLGGDVHFGAAYAMDWTGNDSLGGGTLRTSRIIHFTSSSARNAWTAIPGNTNPGLVRNLMLYNGMATGLQKVGTPMIRLGWNATLPPVVGDLDLEPPLVRIRVQTGPVLLSNEMFRAVHPVTRPPEWIWRTSPITDVRAPADRPVAVRPVAPASDFPASTDAVHHYGDAVAMHVQALTTVMANRGLQFLNNVGLITFKTAGDGIHVTQSLYSLRPIPEPNEKGDAYVVDETRLEPDPVPIPAAVGPGA